MSFSDFKRRSQDNLARLTEEMSKINKSSESYKDDRFWKPEPIERPVRKDAALANIRSIRKGQYE